MRVNVDLPSTDCVSQILLLMKSYQDKHGYIDNALIHLFIHRAIKRSIEASKAQVVVNHFSNVLAHLTMHMGTGDEDWQGIHPCIDDFDEYVSCVRQAESDLCDK